MKKSNNNFRILTYVTQFSINILVPIFMCSAIGYYIDKKLGTSVFFIVLFFIGAIAGGRNIYILARREFMDNEKDK